MKDWSSQNSAYISGPMRGYKHFNFPAFYEAEEYLKGTRCWGTFVNPARIDVEEFGLPLLPDETMPITETMMQDWMRRDLAEVTKCDAIILLPGWETSTGARQELQVALWCGLSVFTYDGTLPHGGRLSVPPTSHVAAVLGACVDPVPADEPGPWDLVSVGVYTEGTVGDTVPAVTTDVLPVDDPWADVLSQDVAQRLADAIAEFDAAFDAPTPAPQAKPLRTREQNEILGIFMDMLAGPTGDGGVKRAAGTKPPWDVDDSHLAKGLGHLYRYLYEGERFDKDSGCNPLIHAAWRFLAAAYQDDHRDGLHVNEEPPQ